MVMKISNEKEGWVWSLWSQMRQKSQRRMRVVETLPLGGKRSLVLVECAGKTFFVGCGGDAVNCIYPAPFDAASDVVPEAAPDAALSTSHNVHEEAMPCTL
jgi:flagellar biogenesis protein FliO